MSIKESVTAENDQGQITLAATTAESAVVGESKKISTSPGISLVKALRRRHEKRKEKRVHPRSDRIWIKRESGQLVLSLRKNQDEWNLSRQAWLDLASVLGIPAALLEKLARLPKDEDCRLMNSLLWEKGSEAGGQIRVLIVDNTVMRISQPEYRSLSAERLAGTLEGLEKKRIIKVIKWDLTDLGWWIVVGFPGIAPFDLSTTSQGEKDCWEATALLFNQEDGKTAAAVVPGLCRAWGRVWLPIAQGHVRRHGGEGDVLMDVVRALHQAEGSDFKEAARKLGLLHSVKIKENEELSSRLPTPWLESQRQAVRAGFIGGRPTVYRLVAAALRVAYTIEESAKKLAMLRVVGLLVLEEGRKNKKSGKNEQ